MTDGQAIAVFFGIIGLVIWLISWAVYSYGTRKILYGLLDELGLETSFGRVWIRDKNGWVTVSRVNSMDTFQENNRKMFLRLLDYLKLEQVQADTFIQKKKKKG